MFFCLLFFFLQTISDFLDEHAETIEKVRGDLERGLKNPETGRSGSTPAPVLRSLILMRVKNWTDRPKGAARCFVGIRWNSTLIELTL